MESDIMDREKFKEEMKSNIEYDEDYIKSEIKRSIELCSHGASEKHPEGYYNLIIVMEELAELSQEVAKCIRNKGDYFGLLEELADVQLGQEYIKQIIKVSDKDLKKAEMIKIKRLEKAMNVWVADTTKN
jgi:NTP pyrophosphatase (non-canonical NTP hydrolase)